MTPSAATNPAKVPNATTLTPSPSTIDYPIVAEHW